MVKYKQSKTIISKEVPLSKSMKVQVKGDDEPKSMDEETPEQVEPAREEAKPAAKAKQVIHSDKK